MTGLPGTGATHITEEKPLQRRLLPPLLGLLVLLLLTFWFALQALNRQQITFKAEEQSSRIAAAFRILQNERAQAMDLAMKSFIRMDPELVPMIAASDRGALRRDYTMAFALFKERLSVSHFYFHGPDRRTVLRMHNPTVFGDEITRLTFVEAAETWTPVSGLELGLNGELSLRSVHPIGAAQAPLGFLELGIEIRDLLSDLREKLGEESGFEYAVALAKDSRLGQQWYESAQPSDLKGAWGTHPQLAVSDYSENFPTAALAPLLGKAADSAANSGSALELEENGKRWLITPIRLETAGGGIQLIALQDVTRIYAGADSVTQTAFAIAALLCILLITGFYQALRRVSAVMAGQRRDLTAANERFDLALSVANDGVWDWNLASGDVSFDDRYYTLAGYKPGAFPNTFEDFISRVHDDDRAGLDSAIQRHLDGLLSRFEVEFRFLNSSGDYQWIRGRGRIVSRDDRGRPLRFIGTHSDITALKNAEQKSRDSAKDLDKRNRVLSSINRLGREMAAADSIEEIGRLTVRELREQDGAPLVGIYLLDHPDSSGLSLKYYDSDRVNDALFSAAATMPLEGSFNGLALREGEILHCNNFENDDRIHPKVRDFFTQAGAKAETILPLVYRGRPIGTIAIVYLETIEYRAQDRWAHDAIAQTTSIAIDNFLNLAKLRVRQRTAEIINELSYELNQTESIEALAQRAISTLQRNESGCNKGIFYLTDESEGHVSLVAHEGLSTDEITIAQEPRIDGTWTGAAMASHSVVTSADQELENRVRSEIRESFRIAGVEGIAAIPLVYKDRVLGAINLLFERPQVFDEGRIMAFESMARTIALALHSGQNTARLKHQAAHDSLTGLPNRKALHEHVSERLSGDSPAGSLAMLLLDLNRFKEVNDTLGHHVGDNLLRALARRVSPLATVFGGRLFRLGGDEFAVVADTGDAKRIAENIVSALKHPFSVDDMNLELGCSIGGSLYPSHGKDSHELLRCADVAMYSAKQQGEAFKLFENSIDDRNPKRLAMLSALREALETNQLRLVYQPRIEIASGDVVACEALLRWDHPTLGNIPPDEFIPLAEITDVIHTLTPWVIHEALKQMGEWRNQGYKTRVSVNISGRNLIDVDFPGRVENLIEEARIPAECLEFEITETALVSDPDRALMVLRSLSALGIAIAIDDFGTGYSSLDYLKRLPLNSLKVDRSFVRDMLDHSRDAAIVTSTIGLAHSLGLRVVAEGAEDKHTCDQLRDLGCEEVQGYVYSPPLPPAEFQEWIALRRLDHESQDGVAVGLP